MAQTSNTLPGSAQSVDRGTTYAAWYTPSNITAEANYAYCYLAPNGEDNERSDWLRGYNFGFSIPTNATIVGIQVQISARATAASMVSLEEVYLGINGDKELSTSKNTTYLTTSQATYTLGGSTDMWGTAISPSQINNSDFGVIMAADNDDTSYRYCYVYWVKVTVFYTENAPQTDATLPGTGANETRSGSDGSWTNPSNITSPTTYAYANIGKEEYSDWLRASNFGFSIPTNYTIDGICVTMKCSGGDIEDSSFRLVDANGNNIGTDKASTVNWSFYTRRVYGGASDTWSASPTPAMINDTDFGIRLSAYNTSSLTGSYAYVYWIRITVYYHLAVTEKTGSDSGSGSDTKVVFPTVALGKSDSGGGTDSKSSAFASLAKADSGAGSELLNLLAAFVSMDSGTGTDIMLEKLMFLAKTGSDSGVGVENTVALMAVLAKLDSGSGSELISGRDIVLRDLGSSSDIAVLLAALLGVDSGLGTDIKLSLALALLASDAGSGLDSAILQAALSLVDSGVGTETALIILTLTDSGIGTDQKIAFLAALKGVDTGTGAEASNPIIGILKAIDAGIGIEHFRRVIEGGRVVSLLAEHTKTEPITTVERIVDRIFGAKDTGLGTEASFLEAMLLIVHDYGTGTDTSVLLAALKALDSGVGLDLVVQILEVYPKFGTDSAIGTDAAVSLMAVLDTIDSGIGSDSVRDRATYLRDAGVGFDASVLIAILEALDSGTGIDIVLLKTLAKFASDYGTGVDLASLQVALAKIDAGSGIDTVTQLLAFFTSEDSGLGTDQRAAMVNALYAVDSGVGIDLAFFEWVGILFRIYLYTISYQDISIYTKPYFDIGILAENFLDMGILPETYQDLTVFAKPYFDVILFTGEES